MTARDNAETADLTLEVGSLREQLEESEGKCRALTVESEGWARQLTEATALLARAHQFGVPHPAIRRDIGAFLSSRAPAQPAARCPTCTSDHPRLHPAMQEGGEVQPCADPWHKLQIPGLLCERPAQPATPTPDITDPPTCPNCRARKPTNFSHYDPCDSCGFKPADYRQPAAPTPTPETPEQVCERLGIDVPAWAADVRAKVAAAQPAAPMPEREYTWDGYALPMMTAAPEPSAGPVACPHCMSPDGHCPWHVVPRVESAEAQLSAVREAYERETASYQRLLDEHGPDLQIDAICCLRDLQSTVGRALTPAPSPGAGEKT